jgi:hypothetical protein
MLRIEREQSNVYVREYFVAERRENSLCSADAVENESGGEEIFFMPWRPVSAECDVDDR